MRTILYIAAENNVAYSGGRECRNRNIESLRLLFPDNVYTYYIHPEKQLPILLKFAKRLIDIFKGYTSGVDDYNANQILELISIHEISDIFIDGGLLGIIAKKIKKKHPDVKVFSFLHNAEHDYFNSYLKSLSLLKKLANCHLKKLAVYNERLACNISDKFAVLNIRDKERFLELYNKKTEFIIPISLKDKASPEYLQTTEENTNKKALFIGSFFHGNVEGLRWFCKEVLPSIDIKLTIVGSGMSQLKKILQPSQKIVIHDRVDDLTPFYQNADFILLPIISGGGMKVKTAEALMYGKYIIGTSESLTGYECSENEALICDNKEQFLYSIKSLNLKFKFNQTSRDLFVRNYSFNATLPSFRAFLSI